MSGKNQYPSIFNWQSTNPQTGFLPANTSSGSIPSTVVLGTCSSTNTIYTNILEVSRMDNHGIEMAWTGTPTGTLTVVGSNSGLNWFSLTFNPALSQPTGSALVYGIDLNQYPWKYVMLQFVNESGSGTVAAYAQLKDLN